MIRKGRAFPLAKNWRKKLDQLCREVVFLRDRDCQWCGGSQNLQWAHIVSRRYLSTRWSLSNSLVLCAGCHLRWHHRPLEGAAWFGERFPERALSLRVIRNGKVDHHGMWILLMQERKRYEAAR